MNTQPLKDKFNQAVWKVLNKIKQFQLLNVNYKDIKYSFNYADVNEDIGTERKIIGALQGLNIISEFSRDENKGDFNIKVNQELFDKVHELYLNGKRCIDKENGKFVIRKIADTRSYDEEDIENNKEVLIVGELKLDLGRTSLQFRNCKPIEIEPDGKPIKLLVLLMRKPDSLVEYKEIAKKVELNCYRSGATNKEVALEVGYIKRDLVKILKEAEMSKEEIKLLIVPKKNAGYKLISKVISQVSR